ncbi:MAG: acyl-ACP desaturase [Acidimicrobiales bacterium]
MRNDLLIEDLKPTVERLMERHLSTTKEWFPHELVPWSLGRDFVPGEEWDPSSVKLEAGVSSALFVNLLTEDNLPYYFNSIDRIFGASVWGEWARRWTAEEQRHSIVIRDYLTVLRLLDPISLERARMKQVSGGRVPDPDDATEALVYVTLQELATRVSHRNTGKLLDDPYGMAIMARVAADENLHYLFYRDLTQVALERDPSATLRAINTQVQSFAMPGVGIEEFDRHSKLIAEVGIYDLQLHVDLVLIPVLVKQWKVGSIGGLNAEGAQAQEGLMTYLERVGRLADRLRARKDEQQR